MNHPLPVVQAHYPDDFAHCYGCGRLNDHGLHLQSLVDGEETVARFQPQPSHIAVPGFVYGGLIASLVDCHSMAAAAAAALRESGQRVGESPTPRYVTASLRVDYLRPTPLGPPLELRSRVKLFTPRKVIVETDLLAGEIITARGEVVAVPVPKSMNPDLL